MSELLPFLFCVQTSSNNVRPPELFFLIIIYRQKDLQFLSESCCSGLLIGLFLNYNILIDIFFIFFKL